MNPVNRLPLEQVEIELKFRTSSIFFLFAIEEMYTNLHKISVFLIRSIIH